MNSVTFPEGYQPSLDLHETQRAIALIKEVFTRSLGEALNLERVSAPLFVDPASGLNDNLNGVERPVSFDVPATGTTAEVVHSLAKWKRYALGRYNFDVNTGLYTDMNAIRRDETLDNLHSVYVDQWDWEKVITRDMRNKETLMRIVRAIVTCVCHTLDSVRVRYPQIDVSLKRNVTFVTSQELEILYPDRTPKERENLFVREHGTVFIHGIGGALESGKPHDLRAPDYDDWSLNGDIFFYHKTLDCAMELSSMGIRVDAESLARQLTICRCEDRRELPFHKMLLNDELPLTMGGGIGQSRLCMLLLGKAHIGEVQSSVWDAETMKAAETAGVTLL